MAKQTGRSGRFARGGANRPRIKEPIQKRSRETRRKILDAAADLFSEMGFDRATTTLIAKRAGFSIGSIYAHFPNKRDMFLTVLDEYLERTFSYLRVGIDRLIAQKHESGIDDVAGAIEWLAVGLHEANKPNAKLNWEMFRFILMDEEADAIHARWEQKENAEIVRLMTVFKDRIKVRDIEAAAIVIHRATHEVFQYLTKNKGEVDEQAVLSEFAAMLKSYVAK